MDQGYGNLNRCVHFSLKKNAISIDAPMDDFFRPSFIVFKTCANTWEFGCVVVLFAVNVTYLTHLPLEKMAGNL